MKVQIDVREKDRVKSAAEYYKEQGLEVSIEELQVGDYIFSDGKDEVVFEFKLVSDFVSSIQSGRVFNQCIEQAENFNHHFCLIHGDLATRSKCIAMTKHYRPVTVFQYISAICSINRYSTVIQVSSPFINESYYTMMKQAEKCLSDKPIVKKFNRKHKNASFNFLCYSVYGINHRKAKLIVDTYNLKSLTDLMNLTVEDLSLIEGIGEKTATNIIEAIHGSKN